MLKKATLSLLTLGVTLLLLPGEMDALKDGKKKAHFPPASKPSAKGTCCDEVRALKQQLANVTRLLEELGRKQEGDAQDLIRQIKDLKTQTEKHKDRVTQVESKYSELNNRVGPMQFQAVEAGTHTAGEAIYDCASLYKKNYRISGEFTLPADVYLGTPEIKLYCDMEVQGGGWTVIQRRKVGLTSFDRDWKQYKHGFGTIHGDFWLGNDNIFRLTRQPSVLRIEMEDWEGETRYAQYQFFTLANELNSYRLLIANYSGNAGDSLRYHNNTYFSAKDKDNDKCVDNCAQLRKGGYWYNCCTDSNLNGVYFRSDENTKGMDGITWYAWHGPNYSLKSVEMKIRPQTFQP